MSEIRNRVWLQDNTKPLEGTKRHPQGRLFNPTGQFSGDPWKLTPENWMGQGDTPAHDDIISWHSSEESSLPRSDEYEHRSFEPGWGTGPEWGDPDADYDDEAEYDNRYSEDSKERPMGEYGSVVGMHFGTLAAGMSRSARPNSFPARIPKETLVEPPTGGFSTEVPSGIRAGMYRSSYDIVNSHTGEREPDTRWSDTAANYAEEATDLVEEGKTVPYRNDVEDKGSTSYRALPETVRTWSEDVMSAKDPKTGSMASKYGWSDEHSFRNKPHPALVHFAEKGYDPVAKRKDMTDWGNAGEVQLSMDFTGTRDPEKQVWPATAGKANDRMEHFNAGRKWSMQRPDSA